GLRRAGILKEAAENSVGITAGITGARIRLINILDEIDLYKTKLEQIETAMEKALRETGLAEYLLSIPGIGPVTAAGFLGEVGELTHYGHWRQLQKIAGLNLVEQSSGQKKGVRTISKRGRSGLRNLLYQASLTLVAKNQEFKALYRYLTTRPQNPLKKKQALIAICNKLLRVMFTLGKEKRYYDADKV
ncbi:transposase, partial [Calderihabitans maritimus]|uniref:transposase n=1 Tax=Calderihabitans maritimus TaxID=1246530 RepID=UPI001177CA14